MCEYCGCEDVAAIAALTAEHDELRGVSREAAHAACGGDRTAAAGRLLTLLHPLHPHTEIEGRALCAGKAGEFAEHVASLREDQCRIDATLILVADPGVAMESWERDLEIYGRRARNRRPSQLRPSHRPLSRLKIIPVYRLATRSGVLGQLRLLDLLRIDPRRAR